jgi:hypothetical protein
LRGEECLQSLDTSKKFSLAGVAADAFSKSNIDIPGAAAFTAITFVPAKLQKFKTAG